MTSEELELRKFEFAKEIQTAELELKKKEIELRIQEQKNKRVMPPIIITLVGGIITIITGIALKYFDNKATLALEDKKFQSSLLLKATDAKNYDAFSDMLLSFQDNGMLTLDKQKIENLRKKRFLADNLASATGEAQQQQQQQQQQQVEVVEAQYPVYHAMSKQMAMPGAAGDAGNATEAKTSPVWTIVAGGEANAESARKEVDKSRKAGYEDTHLWLRQNSYRTCIGKYASYNDAVNALFYIKDKVNNGSYVVRLDTWCPNPVYDTVNKWYICK